MTNKAYVLMSLGESYESIIGVFHKLTDAKKFGRSAFKTLLDMERELEWKELIGMTIYKVPLDYSTPLTAYAFYKQTRYSLDNIKGEWDKTKF
jgi:hypothetical protein